MKTLKLTSLLLAIIMLFAVIGCTSTPAPAGPEQTAPAKTAEPVNPVPGSEPGTEVVPEPEPEPEPEAWKPTGTVTLLVGWDAGGGLDTLARSLTPALSEFLGVDVIVNNMPGANGAVAIEYLLKQPADGQMLFLYSSSHAAYPTTGVSDATYKDLQMLQVCQGAYPVFSVPISSEIETFEQLLEVIKGGSSTAANAGIGSIWHIPQIAVASTVNGSITYVPYDSGKNTALAIAQAETDWGVCDLKEIASYVKDGMVRPLAVYNPEAVELDGYGSIPSVLDYLPDLGNILESTVNYRGIGIRRGADQKVIDTLCAALAYAMESEDFLNTCQSTNTPILNISGEAADAFSITATQAISWFVYDAGAGQRSPEEVGVPRP